MTYQSPAIEVLGNNDLAEVSGAGLWLYVETAVAVLVLVLVSVIDITP